MRTKNKITREQHRVKKAQKQESKVLYFAQDPQVSSRILAVLHVGATKSAVPLYEKKQRTKDIFVYNKKTKKKEKKTITTSIHVFNGQAIKENVMHLKKSSKQNIITLLKSKKYGLD